MLIESEMIISMLSILDGLAFDALQYVYTLMIIFHHALFSINVSVMFLNLCKCLVYL